MMSLMMFTRRGAILEYKGAMFGEGRAFSTCNCTHMVVSKCCSRANSDRNRQKGR